MTGLKEHLKFCQSSICYIMVLSTREDGRGNGRGAGLRVVEGEGGPYRGPCKCAHFE